MLSVSLIPKSITISDTFDAWQLDAGATVGLATKSFGGHINFDTFLKTVTYFGPSDEYVMSGSDDGHIFIWERETVRFNPILIRFNPT